jgi:hypothetical protein
MSGTGIPDGSPFPVGFRSREKSSSEMGNEDVDEDGEIFPRRGWVWGAIPRYHLYFSGSLPAPVLDVNADERGTKEVHRLSRWDADEDLNDDVIDELWWRTWQCHGTLVLDLAMGISAPW